MGADEVWDTPDKIQAEMQRLLEGLPGWERPVAHGVVLVSVDGATNTQLSVANVEAHNFPAVAMSVVTGRIEGTGTFEMSRGDLQRAVNMVAPAEAAKMYQHPNLRAWRYMLACPMQGEEQRLYAVFISSLEDPVSSLYDAALRRQITDGQRSTSHS